MIQQSMRLKVFILPLSLVVTVAMSIFYIKPAYTEMMAARKTVEEKKSQLDNLKNQTQKLSVMKSKWDAMTDEKKLVESAFPDAENVDAYVSELTSKASSSGILLSSIKMDQKSDSAKTTAYVCGGDPAAGASPASTPAQVQSATPAASVATPGTASVAAPAASSVSPSNSCLDVVQATLSATGSWEQVLDYLKYLEDMNRISNIQSVTLTAGNQAQGQPPANLLQADISAVTFFKKKGSGTNVAMADSLASQGKFNQTALDKLKEVIYAPYSAPTMSPSGERNMFK